MTICTHSHGIRRRLILTQSGSATRIDHALRRDRPLRDLPRQTRRRLDVLRERPSVRPVAALHEAGDEVSDAVRAHVFARSDDVA